MSTHDPKARTEKEITNKIVLLYNKGSKLENTQPEFSLLSAPSKQSARQHLILEDTSGF